MDDIRTIAPTGVVGAGLEAWPARTASGRWQRCASLGGTVSLRSKNAVGRRKLVSWATCALKEA